MFLLSEHKRGRGGGRNIYSCFERDAVKKGKKRWILRRKYTEKRKAGRGWGKRSNVDDLQQKSPAIKVDLHRQGSGEPDSDFLFFFL